MLLFYYSYFRSLKYFFTFLSLNYVYNIKKCIVLNKNTFFKKEKGRIARYEILIQCNSPIFYFDFM